MSIPTKLVFVRINGRRRKFCFSVSTGQLHYQESNLGYLSVYYTGHEPAALPTELQCIASVYPSNPSPYSYRHYLLIIPNYTLKPAGLIRTKRVFAIRCGLIPLYLQHACRETTSFSGIWNGSHPIISTILPLQPDIEGE